MFAPHAKKRAIAVTLVSGLFGIIMFLRSEATPVSLWLFAFYAMLVINAFFSVRCFASLRGESARSQKIIDVLLMVSYLAMPFFFNDAFAFMAISFAMFLIAAVKYTLLRRMGEERELLRKKIAVDLLGAFGSALMAVGTVAGYERITIMGGVLATFLVNIDILWLRPLYILRERTPTA